MLLSFLNFFLRFLHYWIHLLVQRRLLFWPPFADQIGFIWVFFWGWSNSCKGNSARHSTCASALPFLPNFFRCPLSSQIYTPMQWSEAKVLIFFFLLSDHFGISFKFLLLTFPLTATNSAEVHSSQFLHCYCSSHFTFLISIISLEHKKILPNIFVSQVIFLFTTKPHLSEWLIWSVQRWLPTRTGLIIDTRHPLSARRPDNYWYPPPCHPWYGKSLPSHLIGWKSSWIKYRAALPIKT